MTNLVAANLSALPLHFLMFSPAPVFKPYG